MHRLPSIRSNTTLLWITNPCISQKLFDADDQKLAQIASPHNCFIIRYTSILKCLKYFKYAPSYERAIVVSYINDIKLINQQISTDQNDLIQLCQYQQIKSILVLSSFTNQNNDNYVRDIPISIGDNTKKMLEIFSDNESMFIRLEELIKEIEESDNNLFTTFSQQENSFKDVHQQLGPFVWSHSYKAILMAMTHHSPEAKREMLTECRANYRSSRKELLAIDNFERSYRSSDAIQWYTKPCFLFRLVNKALRTEDILAFYTFRYYIVDLSMRLKEASVITRTRYTSPFHVYRGARLSRNEVEQLHVGTLVSTNGYLSTSLHLNVAQLFNSIDPSTGISSIRSRHDKQQSVLFKIEIDLPHSPEMIVADVSEYSIIPDEKEFIFDLGTTFIITKIIYDIECSVWRIKMVLSSEVADLTRDYSTYIQKRLNDTSPMMMFGQILSDISSNYAAAMTYFHRLLRTLPVDDEDRPIIYFYLARVYRFIGKYEKAIEYFRCALLLHRRRLPQSSIGYGRTLSGLATTYSEMGDPTRAICLYEKAINIHRSVLPGDHLEIVMELNRLGYAYWQKKEYNHAIIHLSNVLSFYKQKMPTNHPGQAQALHTMGLVQHALGNREQALNYYKQALHMGQSLLSNDHPFVARTYQQISLLYAEQNDQHSAALNYAQRALNIRIRKLPHHRHELKQSIELVKRLSQYHDTESLTQNISKIINE